LGGGRFAAGVTALRSRHVYGAGADNLTRFAPRDTFLLGSARVGGTTKARLPGLSLTAGVKMRPGLLTSAGYFQPARFASTPPNWLSVCTGLGARAGPTPGPGPGPSAVPGAS
jgi:hypothetical protein